MTVNRHVHPRAHRRGHPPVHAAEEGEPAQARSHAAAPLAAVVLLGGLLLGAYSILIPALLGFWLLWTGLSFLSARVNPFSIGFYLTTKPSGLAMAVVFLSGLMLLVASYLYYAHGVAPVVPGFRGA